MNTQPLRVAFLGLRGFPGVQGGVERHVEQLSPLLAQLGCEVDVIVRSPYVPIDRGDGWRGVRYLRVWSPKSKALEALVHTFAGVLLAAWRRPDVLHIQAIGPALMTPLARILGLRVVVTHHGPDYDRQKWGPLAKLVLRLGERFGMRWANARIVISRVILDSLREKDREAAVLIPNGVPLPAMPTSVAALEKFGLESGKYLLMVGRIVPEKRHLDVIEAFRRSGLADWKLAIVGGSDHPDEYTERVIEEGSRISGVICTGFQTGISLAEFYAHAGMFVLPSSHEGMPIALLEALSYGLPVLASDIFANQEIGLPAEHYFPLGDVGTLAWRISQFAAKPVLPEEREARRAWVADRYNWAVIAKQTLAVYLGALGSATVELGKALAGTDADDESLAGSSR